MLKHSFDTYRLYQNEGALSYAVRVRVMMKETVDPAVLRLSLNTAIRRYPYFAVKAVLDEDGGYDLIPNREPVVLLKAAERVPQLGSASVNGHLLFAVYDGREISFYISHAMCGGRGFMPWVMTSIYQYVRDRYHVEPDAPGIRKPESDLLPGETEEPRLESLPDEEPVYTYQSKNPTVLIKDYLNGMMNPLQRNPHFYLYSFSQKDIVSFIRQNDASVASLFMVIMAKALDRVLPEKNQVIGGEIAHSLCGQGGLPDTHCCLLSHLHIDYEREQLKWDMEKLGTMTRGQLILQMDPSVSFDELRRELALYEQIDRIRGLKQKKKYLKAHSLTNGKNASHGTFYINYTGRLDWGELADYVESYVIIVEGHLLLEITSMDDRIFVSFMQLVNKKEYTEAFEHVLAELQIPFVKEGPYPKRLTTHRLPQ
ncbi:MAG: hypothetical protein IKD69_07895 [Solobacterium sp.]|nr:hypothetical protein [Solobacterium sp.]